MNRLPSRNIKEPFGAGVTKDQVINAAKKSGYPLQIQVADVLENLRGPFKEGFNVYHEWSYLDCDSNKLRSLDIYGSLRLHEWEPQPHVRPYLSILIECKQSELPYVFFLGSGTGRLMEFPIIAGLKSDEVEITTDDDPSTWTLSISHALDLYESSFLTEPVVSYSFSKCERQGKSLVLSGSTPYNNLVMPLIKAVEHFRNSKVPTETALYFDAHMAVPLGVLDAPIVCVTMTKSEPKVELVQWVRVLRHEYRQDTEKYKRDYLYVIDIVSKNYLEAYLTEHLIPIANLFSERALCHQKELISGHAFVSGMGDSGFDRIESRLRPQSSASKRSRRKAIWRMLRKSIFGKTAQINSS